MVDADPTDMTEHDVKRWKRQLTAALGERLDAFFQPYLDEDPEA